MSFGSYSSTPASNVSINGINIGENCPAGNLNNVARQLAADGRELWDIVAAINVSAKMDKAGGAFTGGIWQYGAGAYTYYADASMSSGIEYVQPTATALPTSPAEGTKVYQY